MDVLLWQLFSMGDWLHSGVVMMLMNLTVDSLLSLLMSVRLDGL